MVYFVEEDNKTNKKNIFIIIGLICIIFLIIISGAIYYFNNKSAPIDYNKNGNEGTLCPLVNNKPAPSQHNLILIDTTDDIDELQITSIKSNLKEIVNNIPPGGLISIYTISDKNTHVNQPIFEKCKLRDGNDADALTENQKLMQKRYKQEFEQPLNEALSEIFANIKMGDSSPIFERIQFLSVASFETWKVNGPKAMFIFSDMLQNTPDFSMFKQKKLDFKEFKKSSYATKLKTNLNDIDISLYRFNNHPELQTNHNSLFWRDYFYNTGAKLQLVKNLGSDTSN